TLPVAGSEAGSATGQALLDYGLLGRTAERLAVLAQGPAFAPGQRAAVGVALIEKSSTCCAGQRLVILAYGPVLAGLDPLIDALADGGILRRPAQRFAGMAEGEGFAAGYLFCGNTHGHGQYGQAENQNTC